MTDFRIWLRGRMSGDGRSARDIADDIGVSHTALLNWLKGTQPTYAHCQLIADFFKVRVATIRRMAGYEDETTGAVAVSEATLSPEEEALVLAYRAARPGPRQTLLGLAEVIAASPAATIAPEAEEGDEPQPLPGQA